MRPCRLWNGAKNTDGYGMRTIGGRTTYVHIIAWEEENGPVPEGSV